MDACSGNIIKRRLSFFLSCTGVYWVFFAHREIINRGQPIFKKFLMTLFFYLLLVMSTRHLFCDTDATLMQEAQNKWSKGAHRGINKYILGIPVGTRLLVFHTFSNKTKNTGKRHRPLNLCLILYRNKFTKLLNSDYCMKQLKDTSQ